jgi:hypothetical protein
VSEVLDSARLLWPPPLEVSYVKKDTTHPDAVYEQLILPGPASPRICVPADTRRGAARAVMRFSSALSSRQVLSRLVSACVVAAGPSALLRHRLLITGTADDTLRDHLSAALGRRVSLGFGIGTARANRKPVLALFGPDGSALGFAKIGVDPFTDDQVRREHAALSRVARATVAGVHTPELLDFATWNGHPLLVIGALRPSPWQTARRGTGTPYAQMDALARAFGVDEGPLPHSTWWTEITESVRALPAGASRSTLLEAIDLITARSAEVQLCFGAWHGDWTPWNMGWSHGELLLWDFERFEVGAPIGLDVCHFAVSVPQPTQDAAEIVRRLEAATVGRDPVRSDLVKTLYLVAITSRYLVAANSENGRLIAPRAAVMTRCLTQWLSRETCPEVRL